MRPATIDLQTIKSFATEAAEEGTAAAKQAVKAFRRGVVEAEDFKDEAVYRIRRRPLTAVAIAASVSFMIGMGFGWVGGRFGGRG